MTIAGSGHNGNAGESGIVTFNAAVIKMKAEENWTPSANGAFISFETTPPGSSTASRTERMRISGAGNVGIGNTGPTFRLHVVDPGNTGLRVQTNTGGGTVASFGGNGAFQIDAVNVVGGRLDVLENGNIGVGTAAPQARLDVRGDVKLGSSGQLFGTGGEENLKIIRGAVDEAGNIDAGSGFTVSHPFIGEYVITFTTPFSGIPSVTGTGINIDGTAFFVQDFNVTANAVTITLVHNSDSNPVNGPFDFIAVGPR
jgi:hypothetical protein